MVDLANESNSDAVISWKDLHLILRALAEGKASADVLNRLHGLSPNERYADMENAIALVAGVLE